MVEVVSIKFKNRGKCYFFSPNGLQIKSGDKVIVETAKGLEIADCVHGNHNVMETAVVQPLRPVIRAATADDLRVAELNKKREAEALEICQQKVIEHGLDMKLVDVECNFEGNKTTFFFTSDGRVDFRELVKDLAGIFRNRIELRQIGVRDEAKMIGGIGICGRPYCCSQFLDEFMPVSTKMAKVQSLSLNPTKISGSCGRLMCCLRYEQEAYEDLVKKVPKQGAFVQTKDGYGTAVQVNLLRQTVKVKLDDDSDDTLRLFKAHELAAVPGGRPKDGEPLPQVLNYVPIPEEEEEEESPNPWAVPMYVEESPAEQPAPAEAEEAADKKRRRRRSDRRGKPKAESPAAEAKQEGENREEAHRREAAKGERKEKNKKPAKKGEHEKKAEQPKKPEGEKKPNAERKGEASRSNKRRQNVKPVKVEAKIHEAPAEKVKNAESGHESTKAAPRDGEKKRSSNRRRGYYHKPRPKSAGENKQ